MPPLLSASAQDDDEYGGGTSQYWTALPLSAQYGALVSQGNRAVQTSTLSAIGGADMPTLEFVPRAAVLSMQAGDRSSIRIGDEDKKNDDLVFEPKFTESLHYRCVLPRPSSLHLATDEGASELESSVTLRKSATENTDMPVGLLLHSAGYGAKDDFDYSPPVIMADCQIPERQFDELSLAARHGRIPSSIRVTAAGEGVKLGWEPDGSGFDWDNKEHPQVLVAEISFSLPLILPASFDQVDEDREEIDSSVPASHAQMAQLIERTESLRQYLKILIATVIVAAVWVGIRLE